MDKVKRFFRSLWRIPYIKHPVIALFALTLLIILAFLSLNIFTRHGQEQPVPDFRTLSLQDALKQARKSQLVLVVNDSTYIMTRRPSEVVEQQPRPGELVKRGRRVFLTINAQQPQRVPVPNIVGETIRQALILLERNALEVGRLSYSPDIALNSVLSQSYQGEQLQVGDSVPKGSSIDLRLGSGFDEVTTQVPNIIGVTLQEARSLLAINALNVGHVTFDETIHNLSDSLTAKVYATTPKSYITASLPLGAPVNLWLTLNSSRITSMLLEMQQANNAEQEALDE